MAHTCSSNDLQTDGLATFEELPEDAVLLERLDARLESRRKRSIRNNLVLYVVVVVLIVVFGWMYGAPAHLRLAIDSWWGGADLLKALLLLAGPDGTATESVASYILGRVLPFVFLPIFTLSPIIGLVYSTRNNQKQYQERVRLAGLHACPKCASDTRTDQTSCRLCRHIDSERVPPFWRAFIVMDPAFEKSGVPGAGRTDLEGRFSQSSSADSRRRRHRQLLLHGLVIVAIVTLMILIPFGLISSLGVTSDMGVMLVVVCSFCIVKLVMMMSYGTSFNRFSTHGFCPECRHEQLPGGPAGLCQECGCQLMEGCLVYAYREKYTSETLIDWVPLILWFIFGLLIIT
ncbi:MAG: hypothetical protein P8J45_08835 [Phycisphaerales bacterium]|nr:hypothetical protein [Phycisphaerales bacterium]